MRLGARALAPLVRSSLCPDYRAYLLLAVPFAVVFWLIPLTLYAHAGEEWDFPPILLLNVGAIGLLLYLIAAALVRLLAVASARLAKLVAILLFGLGLFLLLAHVYAPIPIGPLDGSALASSEPFLDTILEGGALIVAALLCWHLARGRSLTAAAIFSILLLTVGLGYHITLAIDRADADEGARPPPPPAPGLTGNVYHIVLDTQQTDAFRAVLARRPDLAAAFEGFELYENNISNYITTRTSFASYMTGTLYRSGKFGNWRNSWRRRGLLKSLSDRGYAIRMYMPFSGAENEFAVEVVYNVDIYEQQAGFNGSDFYDFLHIWLASLAPTVLTNEALGPAEQLGNRLFTLMLGRAAPLSTAHGIHPRAGVLMLRQIAAEERQRPGDGQYLYAHAALPHGPFVMDRECRYRGPVRWSGPERRQAYLEQTECALTLVVRFLDQLKALDRYDDATIVMHADTGHGLDDPERAGSGSATLGIPDRKLLSWVNALLMVKPPKADGPLELSDVPTQLIDLYPTLLEILDLEEPGYRVTGRAIHGADGAGRRQAIFGFDPEKKGGSGIVDVRIVDPADLESTSLHVLGPADRSE